MLSGQEIIKQVRLGNIYIDNFDPKKVNANSYNLHLDKQYGVYRFNRFKNDACYENGAFVGKTVPYIDPYDEPDIEYGEIDNDGTIFLPNRLYIMSTKEFTRTNGFVPCIDGRSSIARLGVLVHISSGFGDNGFEGKWTLEVTVTHPIVLYPGMEICQIYYYPIEGETDIQYYGKYQNQDIPTASKLYLEKNA